MQLATETCPLCGSPISRSKFVEITRMREQEKETLARREAEIRQEVEKEAQRQVEAQLREARKLAAAEAQKQIISVAAQRDQAVEKLKQTESREILAHKQAQEVEKRAAAISAERDRHLQKVKQLESREATIRKEAEEEASRKAKKELDQERLILKQAQDSAMLKKEVEMGHERVAWQKKIQDLQRQLEQKTANQLGDGAELDLLEALREAFPDDRINPVPKGQSGADIQHYVLYKGESCGLIIYDSKNHQAWRDQFVTKLREDKVEAGAEYAILSTAVFPRGKKALCVESEIIIVAPAQAPHVAALLREALIRMHRSGLSQKERAGKTAKLYEYIASGEFNREFNHVSSLNEELLKVDVEEQRAHGKVWKERGELLIRQRHALREIDTQIAAIVEVDVEIRTPAA